MFKLIRKLAKACSGAVIIEMALVLPVFLLLAFAIIEYGLIMYVSGLVTTAAIEGSRLGLTGSNYADRQNVPQGQEPINAAPYVQQFMQSKLGPINNGSVSVTAQAFPSFSETGGTPVTLTGGTQVGNAGQVVEYTVTYNWHVLCPLLYPFLGTNYLIRSSTVVKNENF